MLSVVFNNVQICTTFLNSSKSRSIIIILFDFITPNGARLFPVMTVITREFLMLNILMKYDGRVYKSNVFSISYILFFGRGHKLPQIESLTGQPYFPLIVELFYFYHI